jgi:hypothetical protein
MDAIFTIQVEAMKVKLSGAEQQLKEAMQRETMAHAQVHLVKESLAAAQKQHQQQLEQLQQQHEGALAKVVGCGTSRQGLRGFIGIGQSANGINARPCCRWDPDFWVPIKGALGA